MDHNAKTHDYTLFKSLLDSLMDLAQSRLLGIIRNKKRLVDALLGGVSRHRAHSGASPAHHLATSQQEADTHTHTHDSHDTSPGEHRHHINIAVRDDVDTHPGTPPLRTLLI